MADGAPTADQFFASGGQQLPTADEFFGPTTPPQTGGALDAIWNTTKTALGKIANVFGEFGEAGARALDPDSLGLDKPTSDWMRRTGVWNDFETGHNSLVRTFNEAVMRPAIVAGQLVYRAPGVLFGGVAGGFGQASKEIEGAQPSGIRYHVGEAFRGAAELTESLPIALGGTVGAFEVPTPGALAVEGGDIAAAERAATASAENSQVVGAQAARSVGAIGEGEAGFYGAHEITPDNLAARADAAKGAAVEMPEPLPPAPDIHELARRIDPDTIDAWDTLAKQAAAERETLARLDEERQASPEVQQARDAVWDILGFQEDEPLSVRMAREDAFRASAPEGDVARLDTALSHLDNLLDRDTPEMAAVRDRLMQADFAMRDLAPGLSDAYRQAHDMNPQLPLVAEQTAGVGPNPEAANVLGATAEGQAAVAPASATGGEKLGAGTKLEAKPRPIGSATGEAPMTPEEATTVAEQAAAPAGPGGELEDIAGTGELKVRGAAKSLEEKALADKLATDFGGLPEYRTLDFGEQARQVYRLIETDYEQAKRMAMGYEPAPSGIVPSALWSGVANHAAEIGDFETVERLARSRIVTGGTAAGRYVAGFGQLANESPVSKIQEVVNARTAEVAKNVDISKAKADTVAEIKAEMRKAAPKADKWADFIAGLEC